MNRRTLMLGLTALGGSALFAAAPALAEAPSRGGGHGRAMRERAHERRDRRLEDMRRMREEARAHREDMQRMREEARAQREEMRRMRQDARRRPQDAARGLRQSADRFPGQARDGRGLRTP